MKRDFLISLVCFVNLVLFLIARLTEMKIRNTLNDLCDHHNLEEHVWYNLQNMKFMLRISMLLNNVVVIIGTGLAVTSVSSRKLPRAEPVL